ncbi:MAG TPA: ferritin-like domain-containing protein [Steroidobacteraceae bacterium]|nr:ferritin-like domain-containing protein [Steroidobacteraceae bacterium]
MTATSKRIAPAPSFATGRKLRRGRRTGLEPRVVPDVFRADRPAILAFLNDALAGELLCVLRYRRHHFMARRLAQGRIAEEFLVHADEELAHADLLAERIVQLGGEPDFAPSTLCGRSPVAAPVNGIDEMVAENLTAAHAAIDRYRDQIQKLGDTDRITQRLLEGILAVQEAHAEELAELL